MRKKEKKSSKTLYLLYSYVRSRTEVLVVVIIEELKKMPIASLAEKERKKERRKDKKKERKKERKRS